MYNSAVNQKRQRHLTLQVYVHALLLPFVCMLKFQVHTQRYISIMLVVVRPSGNGAGRINEVLLCIKPG